MTHLAPPSAGPSRRVPSASASAQAAKGRRPAFAPLVDARRIVARPAAAEKKQAQPAQARVAQGSDKTRLAEPPTEKQEETRFRERPREVDREPSYLEASGHLTLAALLPPPGVRPSTEVPPAGLGHAEFAAAAHRWLESLRVGRGGHEVRLRLRGDIEVRLENVGGVLRTTLHGDGDLARLARRLEDELGERGVPFERVEIG